MALFSHHNNQERELGQTSVEVGCGVGGTDHIAAPWVTRQMRFCFSGVSCKSKWGDPEEDGDGDKELISS